MNKILYITRGGLPKDAPSIRVERIAKLLQKIGYDVTIMSSNSHEEQVPIAYKVNDDYQIIDNGLLYLFEYRKEYKCYNKYVDFYELLFARKLYNRVVRFCKTYKPDSIVLYNDLYFLTRRLLRFCKKNKIKLFADVTEWYEQKSADNPLPVRLVPVLVNKRITTLDQNLDGIIAISPYLYDFYAKVSSNVIFVPPLMPINTNSQFTVNNCRTLAYAGSPGEKDVLFPLLDALMLVNKEEIHVCLNIVGLSEKEIRCTWKDVSLAEYGIKAYGRLPHKEALKVVSRADFGVLLRHNLRYAKAGFSTKFAECMSMGVPMICNIVGGCDSLIVNGKDGILIENFNKATLIDTLKSIVLLTDYQILSMKNNAFDKAQSLFNADSHHEAFIKLFKHENTYNR